MNCWLTERKRRRRRRRVLRAGAGGLALTGALSLLGLFLPAERVTTARGTFDRPREAVWRVLTDLDGMALWRSDLVRIERLPDLDGRPAWREVGRRGDRVVELAVADPPERLVVQGREPGGSGLPELTFDLAATPGGTLVTLTERRAVNNPLGRVLGRLGALGSPADRLLSDLDRRLGLNRHQVATEAPAADR